MYTPKQSLWLAVFMVLSCQQVVQIFLSYSLIAKKQSKELIALIGLIPVGRYAVMLLHHHQERSPEQS